MVVYTALCPGASQGYPLAVHNVAQPVVRSPVMGVAVNSGDEWAIL